MKSAPSGSLSTNPIEDASNRDPIPPIPSLSVVPPAKPSTWRMARVFATVGLCAFGGVMPWVYRAVVEKEKWLNKTEFTEMASMGMLLPGATTTNMAGMLGYRLGGVRGAIAAVGGLLAPPFVIVLLMAVLYQKFGSIPAVQGAIRGITPVAAGLVLTTAVKLFMGQERKIGIAVFGTAAFVGVTVLRWPLMVVIGILIPLSLLATWRFWR